MINTYNQLLSNSKSLDGVLSIATDILKEYHKQGELHLLLRHREFLDKIPKSEIYKFLESCENPIEVETLLFPTPEIKNLLPKKCLMKITEVINNEHYIIFADFHDHRAYLPEFEIMSGKESITVKNFTTIDVDINEIKDKIVNNIGDYLLGTKDYYGNQKLGIFQKIDKDSYDIVCEDVKEFYHIIRDIKIYYQTKLIDGKTFFCIRIQHYNQYLETPTENNLKMRKLLKDFNVIDPNTDERFGDISYKAKGHPSTYYEYRYIKEPLKDAQEWFYNLISPTRKIIIKF